MGDGGRDPGPAVAQVLRLQLDDPVLRQAGPPSVGRVPIEARSEERQPPRRFGRSPRGSEPGDEQRADACGVVPVERGDVRA